MKANKKEVLNLNNKIVRLQIKMIRIELADNICSYILAFN